MDYTKPLSDDVISEGTERMMEFIQTLPRRSFENPNSIRFPEWIIPCLEHNDPRIFARGSTSILYSLGVVRGIPIVGKIEYSGTRNYGLSNLQDDSVILLTGRWVMRYLEYCGYLDGTIMSLHQLGLLNVVWQKEVSLNNQDRKLETKFPCSFQITYDLSEFGEFRVYDFEDMPHTLKNMEDIDRQYNRQLKVLHDATGNSELAKTAPYSLKSAMHWDNPLERMFLVRARDNEGELVVGDLNHLGIIKRGAQ
ncbi:MAG TPA: hypothetical protein PKA63_06490 [Oligoflexia bacterium]|nr:hypothetical protein [Oligoflexia bacterium]HMP48297.1 hypothetical protein [Oligoflexia bacterium]